MPRRIKSRIAASEWQAGPMGQIILARRFAAPRDPSRGAFCIMRGGSFETSGLLGVISSRSELAQQGSDYCSCLRVLFNPASSTEMILVPHSCLEKDRQSAH